MNEHPASSPQTQPHAGDLFLTALQTRWDNYLRQLKTCRAEFSETAVHDLRVASRRLLAVLDVARALEPHPRIQKVRGALKGQIDSLDELRDVQVMRARISQTIERLPELKPFQTYLAKREKRLLEQARKQIRAMKPSELKKRMEKIRAALDALAQAEYFLESLLSVVDNIYLRARQNYVQVDAAQASTVHRLRLTFKKFRYTVEIIHPLLPEYPNTYLARMHDYQSRMGDIQDVETFLNAVADFADTASTFDLEPVRHFFETRRSELLAAFLEDKGELLTFWRATPDQPFPWETNHDPVPHPTRHRG